MTGEELTLFAKLIRERVGIRIGDSKRPFLVARLGRRLRRLQLSTFRDYHEHLRRNDPTGAEMRAMVEAVTTNTTSFFREDQHFAHLHEHVLPSATRTHPVRIWCSASSTGQEPYSIAMTARDVLGDDVAGRVSILATDIDTRALDVASRGVYRTSDFNAHATDRWQRHMLRGTGEASGLVRVHPDVRRLVTFQHMNLTDPVWPVNGPFDVVFCRNVLIYFDPPTCRSLVEHMTRLLAPKGRLILGHSEASWGHTAGLSHLGDSVYQRVLGATHATPRPRTVQAGDVLASADRGELRTVLGSCVAACLFDPVARVGGMNHFALPSQSDNNMHSARYGVHAMEQLINAIMKLGGDRRRLRAKVFGACHVLHVGEGRGSVADQNEEFVRRFLTIEKIPIAGARLGGKSPLELIFEPTTGRARVRRIESDQARGALAEEVRYRTNIVQRTARPRDVMWVQP